MKKLAWALVPLTVVAVSVSGCSTKLHRPIGLATNLPQATEVDAAMVVVAPNTCPKPAGDKAVPAIASALVATAVDFGVNFIGEWIKTAQTRRNAVWSASGTVTSCDASPWTTSSDREVTVMRAVVGPDGNPKFASSFKLTGDLSFDYVPNAPAALAAAVPGAAPGAAPASPGTIQITWKSKRFAYGRTAAPSRGSKRKHVVVLLGFAPSAVLKTADVATGKEELPGVIRLDLGYLQDGQLYSKGLLQRVTAVSTIPVPKNDTLNVTAIVVETEDESLALKALSAAFESNKSALAGAVKGD